jgi:hypothetical protein
MKKAPYERGYLLFVTYEDDLARALLGCLYYFGLVLARNGDISAWLGYICNKQYYNAF